MQMIDTSTTQKASSLGFQESPVAQIIGNRLVDTAAYAA